MGVGIGEAFDDFPNLRLVVDVSDVQNCCQEDDLVSSIALLGFYSAPFENNNAKPTSVSFCWRNVCFWQQCRTAYSTMEQRFWEIYLIQEQLPEQLREHWFRRGNMHSPERWKMNLRFWSQARWISASQLLRSSISGHHGLPAWWSYWQQLKTERLLPKSYPQLLVTVDVNSYL